MALPRSKEVRSRALITLLDDSPEELSAERQAAAK